MPSPKWLIELALQRAGYQMKRRPRAASLAAARLHLDPWYDQQFLVGADKARLVLDVGANVGQTAREYRKIFPRAKIISFEPFPASVEACRQTSSVCQPMEVHALALSDVEGTLTFHTTSFDPRNSLLPLDESRKDLYDEKISKAAGAILVQATTLDLFCQKASIQHIDVLKLDIQGGELAALRGAHGLLKDGNVDFVFLEVSFTPTYIGQPLFFEIYQLLHENGFVLFDLYNLFSGNTNMTVVEGDALFVHKNRLLET